MRACVRTRRYAYVSARTCTCTSSHLHSCAGTCTRIPVHVCAHTNIHMHKHARTCVSRTCMSTHVHVRACAHAHVRSCTCTWVRLQVHACINMRMHILARMCMYLNVHTPALALTCVLMQMGPGACTRPRSAATRINKLISMPGQPL